MNQKKFDSAYYFFKDALQLSKDDSEILVFLGNILQQNGNIKQAKKYYKNVLAINPNEVKAIVSVGAIKLEQKVRAYIYQAILNLEI